MIMLNFYENLKDTEKLAAFHYSIDVGFCRMDVVLVKWNVWSYFRFYAFISCASFVRFFLSESFSFYISGAYVPFVTLIQKETATEKGKTSKRKKRKRLKQNFTVCLMIRLFEMVVIGFPGNVTLLEK